MIVSVSRRTDIPAFYGEWFVNRLMAGEVLVRNPMNRKQVSSVPLDKENVDCFVFWTKDPGPFLKYLDGVDGTGIPYYFTITINPYSREIEGNVRKKNEIIESVRRLADRIGSSRIIWRYDPIIFTGEIDRDYHLKWFEYLAGEMSGLTEKCVFSFLSQYGKISCFVKKADVRKPEAEEKIRLVKSLAEIASNHQLKLASCAQPDLYSDIKVEANSCVDPLLIEKICGHAIKSRRDSGQRSFCLCAESRDIGTYDTCLHGCKYCYAKKTYDSSGKRGTGYDPLSSMLCDELRGDEIISYGRKTGLLRDESKQGELF